MLHSERTRGFTADPDYWKGEVFVYVGRNQNLKDLKGELASFSPCGVSVIENVMVPTWDTMSLKTADLGLVCVRARADGLNSNTPTEPPFISSTRASALES